jgi:hypothetical protein
MFKIEKKIPFESGSIGKVGRPKIYPFEEMKPGESFFVPQDRLISVRQSMSRINKKSKYKFVSRRVDSGIRVWCMEK